MSYHALLTYQFLFVSHPIFVLLGCNILPKQNLTKELEVTHVSAPPPSSGEATA
ncbi:hypothetical protein E2320_018993, partial [Naja naja]